MSERHPTEPIPDRPEPLPPLPKVPEVLVEARQVAAEARQLILRFLTVKERKRFAEEIVKTILDFYKEDQRPKTSELPDDEQRQVKELIDSMPISPKDLARHLERMVEKIGDLSEANYRKKREVKPRNQQRDEEIVRLRDEEHLSFGKIPSRLKKINPRWTKNNGDPLARDAVEKAYQREKERQERHKSDK